MDVVEVASGKVEKSLPIICIYLLGFTLPEIDAVAVKVGRTYMDMIEQTEIEQKSVWIESLTHDGYFVQIPYIQGKPRTSLEKLLSIFEQEYFIDDKNTIKEYEYFIDNDNVKAMLEILHHAASDSKTKREMEEAWWADKKAENLEKELEEKDKTIEENKKALDEKNKIIEENKKVLNEKDKALETMQKELEHLRKQLSK
jgi:valyl-tRNA synthetase